MKLLSHVQLFATPWTTAYQAPLSMEFSRQEYWSGSPFPSPGIFPSQGSNPGCLHCRQTLYCLSHQGSPVCYKGYESESEVAQSCPTLCDPMDYSLQGSSLHGILQAGVLEWVAISFSKGSPQLRNQTWVSCTEGSFFTIRATREAPSCMTVSKLFNL